MTDPTPAVICPTCPWRVGATAEPIPNFCTTKAQHLRETVGDGSDAFRTIMACHGSNEGKDRPCGGYLAVVGYTNLAVRVAYIDGQYGPPVTDGVDLVDSFDTMLEQLEVPPAPSAPAPARDWWVETVGRNYFTVDVELVDGKYVEVRRKASTTRDIAQAVIRNKLKEYP